MNLSKLTLAISLASTTGVVFADSRDDALKLDSTVITANRDVQAIGDTSTATTVFTRDDIERLRPANVLELLTHAPGVQVASYGGRGSLYGLYIRGTSSAQTLVLVDGVRMNSASAGMAGLQFLSVDQIERVEVLRGSRSALYGADAMGGVVQVFTRRGDAGLQPRLRVAAGSDATQEYSLGLSGGDERTRFNFSAAQESTQGFDRTRTSYASDADHDAYRNRSLAVSLSHQFSDTFNAGLSVLDQRGSTELDNPWGRYDSNTYQSYPAKPYDHFAISASNLYLENQFSENWTSRMELGHSEDRQENFDKLFPGSSANNTYRDSLSWLNTVHLSDYQSVRAGAEYTNDKLRSSNAFAEPSRKNQALFAQHNLKTEHVATEFGVRHDKNEQFGSANTFNAALTWLVDADQQVIVSYSEGFRVPTFADLYWPLDYASWYVGNSSLKPEQSKSYELKWRNLWRDTRFEAVLYRTDFKDLIGSTPYDPSAPSTTVNVNAARVNGLELSAERNWLGWQGQLALSVIDPQDRGTGHTLPNRARRTLSLALDKQLGAVSIGGTLKAVSSSYADTSNSRRLAGYGTIDLRASWQANDELSLDAKWSNVLDKDYSRLDYSHSADGGVTYRYYGYQEAPSQVLVGLTWTPSL